MEHHGYDRITAPDYLGDLPSRPLEEVRAMRAECQSVEADLSYLRRLVQGRLDIVAGEAVRRRSGERTTDASALVAALPATLADARGGPGRGALPVWFGPTTDSGALSAELDRICDGSRLAALPQAGDDELDRLVEDLGDLEREVSGRRTATFRCLDALSAEITRRYRTGEASVEGLLD